MNENKKFWYLVIGFVLLITAGLYVYYAYNRGVENTANLSTDFAISGSDLIAKYKENDKAADSVYLGKVLEVTSIIKSLDKDTTGNYTVILGNGTDASSIRCSTAMQTDNEIASFVLGKLITVKGICTGYLADDMGLGADILLKQCITIQTKN